MDSGGEIDAEVAEKNKIPWPEPNEEGGGVVLPCKHIHVLANIDVDNLSNELNKLFLK